MLTLLHSVYAQSPPPKKDEPPKDSGLDTGEMIGIVIGAIVGVAIIAGLIDKYICKREQEQAREVVEAHRATQEQALVEATVVQKPNATVADNSSGQVAIAQPI